MRASGTAKEELGHTDEMIEGGEIEAWQMKHLITVVVRTCIITGPGWPGLGHRRIVSRRLYLGMNRNEASSLSKLLFASKGSALNT